MKNLAASAALIALSALPQLAAAQSGAGQFCLQTAAGARCVFSSMGECEKAKANSPSGQCITRTDARGATGLGEPRSSSSGVPTEPSVGR